LDICTTYDNSKIILSGSGTQTAGLASWWTNSIFTNSHRRIYWTSNYSNRFNLDNFIVKYYILLNDREEKY
jgi:hypothetical protein